VRTIVVQYELKMRPFSKRHERFILNKQLEVSIPKRLRRRIWLLLEQFDHSIHVQPDPAESWLEKSWVLNELPAKLKRFSGDDDLYAFKEHTSERVAVDLKGFVIGGYPAQVLDVIELFHEELMPDLQPEFQKDINNAFEDENCPWRLMDGQFCRIDSKFMEIQVVRRAEELMKGEEFEGALGEFREARNDLTAGDYKGAIHNAHKSFESTLKTILNKDAGTAIELIRELYKIGLFVDLPERVGRVFAESVFTALPFLRNRLAGHGQGEVVVDIPRDYAVLAVHLAGASIQFVIQRYKELKPEIAEQEDDDDDIPF